MLVPCVVLKSALRLGRRLVMVVLLPLLAMQPQGKTLESQQAPASSSPPPQRQPSGNTRTTGGSTQQQPQSSPPAQPSRTGTSDGPRTQGTGSSATVPTRPPSAGHGHEGDSSSGQRPSSSGDGGAIAAGIGAAAGAIVIGELIAHHNASPDKLGHDGPQVPKEFDMNGFAVKGLVGPNWPVVLDFMIDAPGRVQVYIVAADKRHFQATITTTASHRAYGVFRLPQDFGSKTQIAVFQVQAIPEANATTPAPGLRTYGLGAGERAVGSVAIDELKFQPPMIHPKAKEVANYQFHTHSAFNGVRAEFIYTTLYNGHVLVQKDQDTKLPPIPAGEQARGTWEGKGKAGDHMLQVRAWRGLENGGDWVVAWSPDIVEVVK